MHAATAAPTLGDAALAAGKHVPLEKPPGATVSEIAPLLASARERVHALRHLAFAFLPSGRAGPRVLGATPALISHRHLEGGRAHLASRAGLDFRAGGLGVFDAGINALSILTAILPEPVFVTGAELAFPANRQAPIAAELMLAGVSGLPIHAAFDFRQPGQQSWSIQIETEAGTLQLKSGGTRLSHGACALVDEPDQEYREIYRRFVELIGESCSEVDVAPLALVADAFLLGHHRIVEPFEW